MSIKTEKYFISINSMQLSIKLPDGDPRWGKFTHSFVNCELTQYDIAERICSGHAYCTWLVGGRKKEHFQLAQHIALDFDTEDERSSIDSLISNRFIRMYGGLIHTTPSHTPQNPRARVIFFLDRPYLEIGRYEAALQFMIDLFRADQSCSDATRYFYGAMDCEIAPIGGELPIAHLRAMYKRYIARFPRRNVPAAIKIDNWPGLRATTADASVSDIEAALKCLPPHLGEYQRWLSVLMAVHSELGMDGVPLCERYIPGYPGEVERKFRSFKNDGVGIGTLFHIAKEYGYQALEVSPKL